MSASQGGVPPSPPGSPVGRPPGGRGGPRGPVRVVAYPCRPHPAPGAARAAQRGRGAAIMISEQDLLGRFDGVPSRNRDGDWHALCPCHADGPPVATHHAEGRPLAAPLLRGMRNRGRARGEGPRMVGPVWGERQPPRVLAEYDYVDERGKLLSPGRQVRRPRTSASGSPTGWVAGIWKTSDVRKVVYRLPKVLEAIPAAVAPGLHRRG